MALAYNVGIATAGGTSGEAEPEVLREGHHQLARHERLAGKWVTAKLLYYKIRY